MENSFEKAHSQLQTLIPLFEENPNAVKKNEAQTRFEFIDLLLFDCLGWSRADCLVEERIDGLITDYTLSNPRRALIVEAKKAEKTFELPASDSTRRIWNIPKIQQLYPDLYDAVVQVTNYATQRGTLFAAVCNGHQICAFMGSRTDGVEPLEGRAVIFWSLRDMENNFFELWNLLSKSGIAQRRMQILLQSDGTVPPPSKLCTALQLYPGLKRRNAMQVQLAAIAQHLFEGVLLSHGELAFLNACYCKSGPLAEYASISKNILRSRYSTLFEQKVKGPQLEPAVRKTGEPTPELIQSPPGSPVLLLGDVGVGKSLFLSYFIQVDAADMSDSIIFVNINLLSIPTLRVESIFSYVVNEVKEQLSSEHDIHVDDDQFVRNVYHRELEEFMRTPYGRLKVYPKRFSSAVHAATRYLNGGWC